MSTMWWCQRDVSQASSCTSPFLRSFVFPPPPPSHLLIFFFVPQQCSRRRRRRLIRCSVRRWCRPCATSCPTWARDLWRRVSRTLTTSAFDCVFVCVLRDAEEALVVDLCASSFASLCSCYVPIFSDHVFLSPSSPIRCSVERVVDALLQENIPPALASFDRKAKSGAFDSKPSTLSSASATTTTTTSSSSSAAAASSSSPSAAATAAAVASVQLPATAKRRNMCVRCVRLRASSCRSLRVVMVCVLLVASFVATCSCASHPLYALPSLAATTTTSSTADW